ncbi:hypothetical protein AVEN_200677-1, partial [Araneus ventricosus]
MQPHFLPCRIRKYSDGTDIAAEARDPIRRRPDVRNRKTTQGIRNALRRFTVVLRSAVICADL